jgi:uncharacterized protein
MSANDRKALTYTSDVLDAPIEVTGRARINLWISSEAPDIDIVVYLEEVDASGYSHYVTEGALRASFRKTGAAPYSAASLIYHPSRRGDVEPLKAGEPVELTIGLDPVSRRFAEGSRIRLAIVGADRGNLDCEERNVAPVVSIYRTASYPSRLTLPTIGEDVVSKLAVPTPPSPEGLSGRALGSLLVASGSGLLLVAAYHRRRGASKHSPARMTRA